MTDQSEALRVAQALELDWRVNLASNRDAIRLLREQHAEIERLKAALQDIARQPEGDEESAQSVAKAVLRHKP